MGTEAFWIPAVIAAVGSGAEAYNQHQALSKQDTAEAQSIQDQQKIAAQASQASNKTISDIQKSNPNQIAAKATGEYVDQLRRNAAGSAQPGASSALAPVAGASSRYKGDVTKAQTESQSFGDTLAGQLGNIDAATRQRQNEALSMNTLGTNLNLLNAQSFGQNFVDQLRAQTAGQANPWVSLGAGLLKSGAAAYAGSVKSPTKVPGFNIGQITDAAPAAPGGPLYA
jgi:hypothetical protein